MPSLALQTLFNGIRAVGAGDDQPVEGVPFSQGIVEGTPVIRGADLQSR